MQIDCDGFQLRPWRDGDQPSLVRHANDREIWRNLRDRFPHPYTARDADTWVEIATRSDAIVDFAIAVDGEAVGGIGFVLQQDVERCSAEIGFWLGKAFWGRGIMTTAVRAATPHAFTTCAVTRVFALPFAHNSASCRVLEKAGYLREGILRRSAIKEAVVIDRVLYSITDRELDPGCRTGFPRSAPGR